MEQPLQAVRCSARGSRDRTTDLLISGWPSLTLKLQLPPIVMAQEEICSHSSCVYIHILYIQGFLKNRTILTRLYYSISRLNSHTYMTASTWWFTVMACYYLLVVMKQRQRYSKLLQRDSKTTTNRCRYSTKWLQCYFKRDAKWLQRDEKQFHKAQTDTKTNTKRWQTTERNKKQLQRHNNHNHTQKTSAKKFKNN